MGRLSELDQVKKCSTTFVLAVNDTLNVINGKWKLPIIGSLLFGKKRFREMEREIPKITPRMLSKELKDLEANGIVKRTVHGTIPVTVEYELTKSGDSFKEVMDIMVKWGLQHRKNTFEKN
jgi:DNA-binding HxlR family transcriptional regulator